MAEKWSPEFELKYFRGVSVDELLERHRAHAEIFDVDGEIAARCSNPSTVIEVGCGGIGGMLSAYGGGSRRLAIDPLADQYAELNPDISAEHRMEWVRAYAHSLPLQDDSVDVAFCLEALDHSDTRERFFRAMLELVRVLRQGGLLFFMVPTRPDRPDGHDGHPVQVYGVEIFQAFRFFGMKSLRPGYEREGEWMLLQKS